MVEQIEFRVELGALGAQFGRLIDPDKFRDWFVKGEAQRVSKPDGTHSTLLKQPKLSSKLVGSALHASHSE